MTETEKIVAKFVNGFGGQRYQAIFDILQANNLRPLGKSNTETLLFQFRGSDSMMHDIFAFRLGPPSVISFPKSYWLGRATELNEYLSNFSYSERPATTGPVSSSQNSAGQVEITRSTHERIVEVCSCVCASLQ
ncbi:hypothetical protein VXM60_19370 [Shewanella khirikhana]|uniref:hypothetical protein n=1 Tax=Shewanella khirikhana TaxID=1965282 RepID=UPI0030CD55A9